MHCTIYLGTACGSMGTSAGLFSPLLYQMSPNVLLTGKVVLPIFARCLILMSTNSKIFFTSFLLPHCLQGHNVPLVFPCLHFNRYNSRNSNACNLATTDSVLPGQPGGGRGMRDATCSKIEYVLTASLNSIFTLSYISKLFNDMDLQLESETILTYTSTTPPPRFSVEILHFVWSPQLAAAMLFVTI